MGKALMWGFVLLIVVLVLADRGFFEKINQSQYPCPSATGLENWIRGYGIVTQKGVFLDDRAKPEEIKINKIKVRPIEDNPLHYSAFVEFFCKLNGRPARVECAVTYYQQDPDSSVLNAYKIGLSPVETIYIDYNIKQRPSE